MYAYLLEAYKLLFRESYLCNLKNAQILNERDMLGLDRMIFRPQSALRQAEFMKYLRYVNDDPHRACLLINYLVSEGLL